MLPTIRTPHDAPPPLLLIAGSSPAPGGPEARDEIASIRDKHLRVLVVDDMRGFRESTRVLLEEKYAAAVADVGSGPEAVEALRAGAEFDLVLLDIQMQPINGIKTCEELRRVDAACPVVLMSAYAQADDWEVARRLGVDLIQKPLEEKVLNSILLKAGRGRP